ncbi:MAG: hypothetical protein HY906_08030 [Deltaproteobacteria bacterium]|nr:hypothetical protein [Deltaproteobacteria bacterium]
MRIRRPFVRSLDDFVDRLVRIPYSPFLFIVVPAGVACLQLPARALTSHPLGPVAVVFGLSLDYLLIQVLIAAVLSLATGRSHRQFAGLTALVLVLGWLGRMAEALAFRDHGQFFSHHYALQWDALASPQEVWHLVVICFTAGLVVLIVAVLTRSVWRTLAALGGFALAFWVHVRGTGLVADSLETTLGVGLRVEGLTLALLIGFHVAWHREALAPSLRRLHGLLPLALVSALGARLAGQSWGTAATRAVVVGIAAALMLFAHDHFERQRGGAGAGEGSAARPDDVAMVFFFQFLLAAGAMFLVPGAGSSILLLLVLGAAYYLPGLRFGRLLGVGYAIHGAAAAACFLFGAAGPDGSWRPWVRPFAAVMLAGFALVSMLAGAHTVERDRAAGIATVYTRLLDRGWSWRLVHGLVCPVATLVLFVPPVWLRSWRPSLAASMALVALALLPPVLGLGDRDRTPAGPVTVWLLTAYLAVLMMFVPALR